MPRPAHSPHEPLAWSCSVRWYQDLALRRALRAMRMLTLGLALLGATLALLGTASFDPPHLGWERWGEVDNRFILTAVACWVLATTPWLLGATVLAGLACCLGPGMFRPVTYRYTLTDGCLTIEATRQAAAERPRNAVLPWLAIATAALAVWLTHSPAAALISALGLVGRGAAAGSELRKCATEPYWSRHIDDESIIRVRVYRRPWALRISCQSGNYPAYGSIEDLVRLTVRLGARRPDLQIAPWTP